MRTRVLHNTRNQVQTKRINERLAKLLWQANDALECETDYAEHAQLFHLDEVVHGHPHPHLSQSSGWHWRRDQTLAHPTTCHQCACEFYVVFTPTHPALKMPLIERLNNAVGRHWNDSTPYCPVCSSTELEISSSIIPCSHQ